MHVCCIAWFIGFPFVHLKLEKKNSMNPRRRFFPGSFRWFRICHDTSSVQRSDHLSCRTWNWNFLKGRNTFSFELFCNTWECHALLERLQSSPSWLLYDLTPRLGSNWIQNSRDSQFFSRHTCTWRLYQNLELVLPILPVASPKSQGGHRVAHCPHRPLSRPRCLKPRIRK